MYETSIFFYNKLNNIAMINKISSINIIKDGYIFITEYDKDTNTIVLGDKSYEKKNLLCGKLVSFNMTLEQVVEKISGLDEVKFPNREKYTIETIHVQTYSSGTYKAYIIY